MTLADISFGTDGWRARIAEDYTFDNVRRCAQGFAGYLKATNPDRLPGGVVVGGDKRFLSEQFAASAAGFWQRTESRSIFAAAEFRPRSSRLA